MPQREGEGGGSTSIWRPDDVSLSRGPCWRTSYLFEVFDPSCILFWQSPPVYTKSYSMTFSWWKGGKALYTCKTPRILRAYRMVSKPTKDWKTVGGQKIFLLFGKRRPSTEVKQWMLRSMCDGCSHKICIHHVTNRSHNLTRHNDPKNSTEQMSSPHLLKQIPDNRYLSFAYYVNFEWAFFSPE